MTIQYTCLRFLYYYLCFCYINSLDIYTIFLFINYICPFTDLRWLSITLAMIGKMGITGSYNIIYVFTAEMYPTVVRNVAVGSSSMIARIGGALAPYINMLVSK